MNAYKPLFVSMAATLLGACATAPSKPSPPPVQEKTVEIAPQPVALPRLPASYTEKGVAVKIDSLWQAADGKILGVNGTAKNVTASDLKFCQISLGFMDKAGIKVDDAKASTKTLKSAQTWHFQAALAAPSETPYSSVTPEKVIAIPVKIHKAELASLK